MPTGATKIADANVVIRADRRRLLRRLAIVASLLVLAWFARGVVVRSFLTDLLVKAPNHGRSMSRISVSSPPVGLSGRALRIDVAEGEALALWVLEPEQPAVGTVFVLHGIRSSKGGMIGFGRALVGQGLRAVLVDLRGHGESDGQLLSYGLQDRRDLGQLLDALLEQGRVTGPIGALGFSYGASTACLWAAEDPRLRAVVSLAAFADLPGTLAPAASDMLGPLALLICASDREAVLRAGSERVGADLRQSRPIDAVSRSEAVFWFGHARDDPKIPFADAERLAAAAAERGSLHPTDTTGHDVSAFRREPKATEWARWLRVQLVRSR